MKVDISKILFDKYCSESLAHFYLLKAAPTIQNRPRFLRDWVESFLHKCTPGTGSLNVSDVLVIEKDDPDSEYVLSDFDELFRTGNHVPLEMTYRFIVVYDAHQIKPIILNKLLKLLEEPQKRTSIFFVNPSYQKILPTILSRAVTLVIPDHSKTCELESEIFDPSRQGAEHTASWFDKKITTKREDNGHYLPKRIKETLLEVITKREGESSLVEQLAKDKAHTSTFLQLLIEWERSNISNYEHKAKFLSEINWFKKALTYNNPPQERLFSLLTTCLPEQYQNG